MDQIIFTDECKLTLDDIKESKRRVKKLSKECKKDFSWKTGLYLSDRPDNITESEINSHNRRLA